MKCVLGDFFLGLFSSLSFSSQKLFVKNSELVLKVLAFINRKEFQIITLEELTKYLRFECMNWRNVYINFPLLTVI